MIKILVVEDERIVALELESRLTGLGYSVCGEVSNGEDAINNAIDLEPDLILMDINIKGDIDGIETAQRIRQFLDIPVIFLTAFNDPKTIERAKIIEPYGYIVKPFEERELHTNIEIALYKHKMEKKLRASERNLSVILKSIGDAVIATDKSGSINYMNHAAEELTDILRQDAIGKYVFDVFKIVDPEVRKTFDISFSNLEKDNYFAGFPQHIEIAVSNSENRIIDANASIINEDKGNIEGLVFAFRDITETYKAQIELKERKVFIETVLNNIQIGIGVYKLNTKDIIYTNDEFKKIFGLSRNRIYSKNDILELAIPSQEYASKLKVKIQDAINSGDVSRLHWDNIKIAPPNQGEKYISVSLIPLSAQRIMITRIQDVTYEVAAEEKILQLSAAVEQSPVSVTITDTNGFINYANPAYISSTGYSKEEVIGKNIKTLRSNGNNIEYYNNLFEVGNNGEDWSRELQFKNKNGDAYWELVSISPIKNSGGEITHYLSVQEDITARKNYEQGLIKAKESAEESSKLKSNFLANMSHELRTPMIGILGYADVLIKDSENPEHRKMLEIIQTGANRLLKTLDMVLDLARIESNSVEITRSNINFKTVVEREIKNFLNLAGNKKLYLKTQILDGSISANLDEQIFIQIFHNLVSNAIKFTNNGGVTVEVNSVEEHNQLWAVIRIIDTGIGIPQSHLNIIFEEFRQASEGYGRSHEGIGLGLTLIKRSVELMNGRINVRSKEGEGSTFTIYFPAAEDSKKSKGISENNGSPGNKGEKSIVKLLVVENDKITSDYVNFILRKNYSFDLAMDGLSAIKMANENKYALILMDIGLGLGMNGVEASQEIRKINGYEKIPIVAMTAYAMKGDKERFFENGLNYYLPKPFDKNDLINMIQLVLNTQIVS